MYQSRIRCDSLRWFAGLAHEELYPEKPSLTACECFSQCRLNYRVEEKAVHSPGSLDLRSNFDLRRNRSLCDDGDRSDGRVDNASKLRSSALVYRCDDLSDPYTTAVSSTTIDPRNWFVVAPIFFWTASSKSVGAGTVSFLHCTSLFDLIYNFDFNPDRLRD